MLVAFGAWGCAPSPELVYVDVAAVPLTASTGALPTAQYSGEGYAISEQIPDLQGQDFLIGSAEERAVEALRVSRQAQQDAATAVLERLKKAYLGEAALYEQTEQAALRDEYAKWVDAALQELHALFLAHAEKVEPLRYGLTKLVGFPDPDPGSVKVPLPENVEATKTFQAAKALREQIAALDAAYKSEVGARMATIERQRTARLAAIQAKGTEMREEAVAKARREADSLAQKALAALESTALDPEAKLPPVPGASSSVNFGPVSVSAGGGGAAPTETRSDVEAQLQVFLKAYGYRLTKNPNLGRNVTQEFVAWRQKYRVGR